MFVQEDENLINNTSIHFSFLEIFNWIFGGYSSLSMHRFSWIMFMQEYENWITNIHFSFLKDIQLKFWKIAG